MALDPRAPHCTRAEIPSPNLLAADHGEKDKSKLVTLIDIAY